MGQMRTTFVLGGFWHGDPCWLRSFKVFMDGSEPLKEIRLCLLENNVHTHLEIGVLALARTALLLAVAAWIARPSRALRRFRASAFGRPTDKDD